MVLGHRVVYDDTINVNYTNSLAQPFQLQQLCNIAG
jgi:hypothetical protein